MGGGRTRAGAAGALGLPVAFGFGIVGYFTAERERAAWAAAALALAGIVIAYLARRRAVGFAIALGFAAIAAGFATPTLRTEHVAHPVLQFPLSSVTLSGFVEIREERERSDRIVVRVQYIEARRLVSAPQSVRVAVRKNTAPPVGSFIELKAHLSPATTLRATCISSASAPPAMRSARSRLWRRQSAPAPSCTTPHSSTVFARRSTSASAAPGDRGSIASALITCKRDAISAPVNDAMYISSLAHVLSISGYHMAVVAGIVFFFIRAGLALVPSFASRQPIKKWAAGAALVAAAFYLVLSSAEVATQRSFIMIAIVLIGIMVNRPTLTFRTLTVAAFGVLLLVPDSVVHPSFQMSFAATLALIATYEHGCRGVPRPTRRSARAWLCGVDARLPG